METILIAVIVAVPPTIAAVGALIIGIRNGRQADAAKLAAAVAAETAARAALAAEHSQAEIIATKDGVFEVGARIDGRLTDLLALTERSAFAKGKLEGRAERGGET